MRRALTALILTGMVLLSGCVAHTLEGSEYPVYFLDQAEDGGRVLKAEHRSLDPEAQVIEGLLLTILAGPESETLTSVIPGSVSLRGWTLQNGLLTVDVSGSYGTLSGIDLTLADYSIVLTLSQLEEVEAVMITVEGQVLAYRDHQRLTPEDVQISILQDETMGNAE